MIKPQINYHVYGMIPPTEGACWVANRKW